MRLNALLRDFVDYVAKQNTNSGDTSENQGLSCNLIEKLTFLPLASTLDRLLSLGRLLDLDRLLSTLDCPPSVPVPLSL